VPLSTISFATLPPAALTQATALFSLVRNIGSSIGIAILEALFVENSQTVDSRLVETIRPDNPLVRAPDLLPPHSLSATSGIAALNAEVTRQAEMVAYIDDFKLMMTSQLQNSGGRNFATGSDYSLFLGALAAAAAQAPRPYFASSRRY
jgi:DHA2 family multidrug resistance protein